MMIIDCGACSAQNFVSAERLAVREIPPRCWKCGCELEISPQEIPGETPRIAAESNGSTDGEN